LSIEKEKGDEAVLKATDKKQFYSQPAAGNPSSSARLAPR
jgi:hypothetical protein